MAANVARGSQASESQIIISAARRVLEREGSTGFRVHDVLSEAGIGTRALYRHFDSRDALVLAVFVEAAEEEALRLRSRMEAAPDPLGAVSVWIEARLELAFDEQIGNSMRDISLEAHQASRDAPEQMEIALDRLLEPLVEQLALGQAKGLFVTEDPVQQALSIQDIVWGQTLRQWSGIRTERDGAHVHVLRFCLRGIGAPNS
jgi:AcrR family transcriptional regulator